MEKILQSKRTIHLSKMWVIFSFIATEERKILRNYINAILECTLCAIGLLSKGKSEKGDKKIKKR